MDVNEYQKDLNDLNEFSFLWNENNNNKKAKSKLLNAMHWYRKAEQSINQEDKMLNYWIAIENLFNLEINISNDIIDDKNKKSKIHLIQKIISSIQIFKFVYDYGWELYNHYKIIVLNPFQNNLNLPKELLLKSDLDAKVGESIHLENFIKSLHEIKNYETDLFILQKIEDLILFYENPSFTKKTIEKQIILIENDILMIYRFRNLIVHNAHFDNALLPYFVWKVRDYCGVLIRKLISEYKENDRELSNIMIEIYLNKDIFLSDLENGKGNLFKK